MKKTRVFYLVAVLALLVASVVMFSGIARAGAVPDGFMGIPWGASKDQIIKTMSERGYRQLTSEESNQLHFKGDFAGVPCLHLYFSLRANSFYSGSAWGCAWSTYHRGTQAIFERMVNTLSEKYGPPQKRESGKIDGKDVPMGRAECMGSGYPTGWARWDFVDSRSDKYSIEIALDASSYYDMTEKVTPCRVDIYIIYEADSLEERLKKKEY
jgi:hypothetical protein